MLISQILALIQWNGELGQQAEAFQAPEMGVRGRRVSDEEVDRFLLVARHQHVVSVIGAALVAREQFLQQAHCWQRPRPVGLVVKHHWAERVSLPAVVVAHGVLKNLLQRARLARRENDAVRGDGDEPVFAQAVLEIFADARRKRRRRLVTVIPGRHGETFTRAFDGGAEREGRHDPLMQGAQNFAVDLARRRDDLAGIRRQVFQCFQFLKRCTEGAVGLILQQRAKMRRFHGARAATARHEKPLARQRARHPRHGRVYSRIARLVMTAHDGGHLLLAFEESERGLRDGIVVQGFVNAGQGISRSGAAVAHVIREAFEIRRAREGTVVARAETRHQFMRGIERFPDGAEWNSGEHRRRQGSRKRGRMVLFSSSARRGSLR